jgi:hypothetical protein
MKSPTKLAMAACEQSQSPTPGSWHDDEDQGGASPVMFVGL